MQPTRKLSFFAGGFGWSTTKGEPMAEMWLLAFDDAYNCPNKRLENAEVMKRDVAIPDELHDIVKERVMISHGAA
jgi:predicted enzyme related to lactoylglutathione lyase